MADKPKPPACSICGEPAVAARVLSDGEPVPYCATHIPSEEARDVAEKLRDLGWDAPGPKPIN